MIYRNYETLPASEQDCYRELVKQIEAYQTEWTFQQLSFQDVAKVFKAVRFDHPEYFWLGGASKGTTRTTGNRSALTFQPEYLEDAGRVPQLRFRFEERVTQLLQKATRESSVLYEQILFLHDELIRLTDYVEGAAHCYDAYGCIVLGRAVCAGYSAAFQVLMQRLGVECGRVSGMSSSKVTGDVTHSWNYIKLSDGYYYIDVTWDDPRINGECVPNNLSHNYFCIDENELLLTHRYGPDQFIPRPFGARFEYYRYRGLLLENYTFFSVCRLAMPQLQRSDSFTIKFKTRAAFEEARKDLFVQKRVLDIPGITKSVTFRVDEAARTITVFRK